MGFAFKDLHLLVKGEYNDLHPCLHAMASRVEYLNKFIYLSMCVFSCLEGKFCLSGHLFMTIEYYFRLLTVYMFVVI